MGIVVGLDVGLEYLDGSLLWVCNAGNPDRRVPEKNLLAAVTSECDAANRLATAADHDEQCCTWFGFIHLWPV